MHTQNKIIATKGGRVRADIRSRWLWAATSAAVLLCLVLVLRSKWAIPPTSANDVPHPKFNPRITVDESGLTLVQQMLSPWQDPNSFAAIQASFHRVGYRSIEEIDRRLSEPAISTQDRFTSLLNRGLLFMFEGEPARAYADWSRLRELIEQNPTTSQEWLSSTIFLQGVAGMRRGETENCIDCRGEGACVFPILSVAVHQKPEGSRLAVRHFTEYLERHPDDRAAMWLLNIAHMTLGEHPQGVAPQFLLSLDRFQSEPTQSLGAFRNVAHLAGVNRLNQAGGAIMEDFNNDGLLDIVASSMDTSMPLAYYVNKNDGTFEDQAEQANLKGQLGGLNCVQTDYNNDGWMDIFVIRGAWFNTPMRPSLLKNNGNGTFSDVTQEARLLHPLNAIFACWTDYDNDGNLDLFIGCDNTPHRLYRNNGSGAFDEVAKLNGVMGNGKFCRGASWGDFDRDGDADLFVNYLNSPPQLFRNDGFEGFRNVAGKLGINGPTVGFSCWFWDYDNDGWLDIYATGYERNLNDTVRGLIGESQDSQTDRLYRNLEGTTFQDVSQEAGVAFVTAPMGTNFGDFDNDGFLDFYLGTGWPGYSALVPNRMFRNVDGKRFADITIPSRTGHLQKGHGVACGDWDRDGHVDLFVQIGGATPGDVFHNALFQNPAQEQNSWLNVKLVGQRTNRAAIGARIKALLTDPISRTVYRHVSSGSSFGANPLEQLLGLGKSTKITTLEIEWPTSKTIQVFHDVAVNQAIEITEFADTYRKLDHQRVPAPY